MTASTALPLAPGTWTLDATHSGVQFRIRHLGLTDVRGRFNRFEAVLVVGASLTDSSVEATVAMDSVDTNHPERDAHLLSTDFFAADAHPAMQFRSTAIRPAGGDRYALAGDLTINGVTRRVVLDVEFNGTEAFPLDGTVRAGFAATGEINRDDFGIAFNMPLGLGKAVLGKRARIEIDAQFVAPTEDNNLNDAAGGIAP